MWWECSTLFPLWASVEDLLSEILHYPFKLTPKLAILDINLVDLPTQHRTLVHHTLLANRLTKALTERPHTLLLSRRFWIVTTPNSTVKLNWSHHCILWIGKWRSGLIGWHLGIAVRTFSILLSRWSWPDHLHCYLFFFFEALKVLFDD